MVVLRDERDYEELMRRWQKKMAIGGLIWSHYERVVTSRETLRLSCLACQVTLAPSSVCRASHVRYYDTTYIVHLISLV